MSHTAHRAVQRKLKSDNLPYAESKFLIYNCWQTIPGDGRSPIAGSLLLDCAMTQEEADEKVAEFTRRSEDFARRHPVLHASSVRRYAVIANKEEWWYDYVSAE
jgi:hypothetical protein